MMANNMASSDLWEILYLPQMVPLVKQRGVSGAKI